MGKWIDGRRLRRGSLLPLACLIAAFAVVVLAAGCGGSGDADSSPATSTVASRARRVVRVEHVKQDRWTYARARFNEICAGCHTLADAGATGRRYNLDHTTAVDETHVRATIAGGEPGMPAFRDVLSEREYEELVAYVSTVARRTPGDDLWHDQLALRGEGAYWSPEKTRRLEAYARRLALRR
jgi:mono/diheme cytochrome c family protein